MGTITIINGTSDTIAVSISGGDPTPKQIPPGGQASWERENQEVATIAKRTDIQKLVVEPGGTYTIT